MKNSNFMNNINENLKTYDIECSNSNQKKINATINIWIEKKMNPEIQDIIENKIYKFSGQYDIYIIKYQDEDGNHFIANSDRLNNAFYSLCKLVENENIRMLIKGCHLQYYMIPRLKNTIYCTPLTLGKRLENNFLKINIFDFELDINKIVNIQRQKKYYEEWLDSIKGTTY